MEDNHTDKDILSKGLKILGFCLICMFAGPSLFRVAQLNQSHPTYWALIVLSILICVIAVYLLFKGINTILDSIFKKK